MEIKKGTKVWLLSGSPAMIVKIQMKQLWVCTWFVGTNVQEHSFSAEQLTDKDPKDNSGVYSIG